MHFMPEGISQKRESSGDHFAFIEYKTQAKSRFFHCFSKSKMPLELSQAALCQKSVTPKGVFFLAFLLRIWKTLQFLKYAHHSR